MPAGPVDDGDIHGDPDGEAECPICGPPIAIDQGTTLRPAHLTAADRPALEALYGSLSAGDLHRRFFGGTRPPPGFFETWSSIPAHGGFVVGGYLETADGAVLIGEAGYALLDDGDGELGMAVDPTHRGWLGPWLLDLLVRHAADRGVPNIQALVLTDNRAMIALAAHRGFAVLDHPDWGTVRLTMSTAGATPSWPRPHGRPRILVESTRSRWSGEDALRDAGFDVAICAGACQETGRCPIVRGEPCPLVDGADAVVVDLAPDDPRTVELVAAERIIHPGIRLIAGYEAAGDGPPRHRTGAEIVDELDDLTPDDLTLDDLTQDPTAPDDRAPHDRPPRDSGPHDSAPRP